MTCRSRLPDRMAARVALLFRLAGAIQATATSRAFGGTTTRRRRRLRIGWGEAFNVRHHHVYRPAKLRRSDRLRTVFLVPIAIPSPPHVVLLQDRGGVGEIVRARV